MLDKNGYIELKKEVVQYTKEILSQNEIEYFAQHIDEKLRNFKPTLMIYGAYNAGKSTLLNALFGQEEMAITGDAPETKEVHSYEYNGYTIFDTPGLNAKNEDDIVTAEQFEKSELILFVLSNSGSLEEEFIYKKISEVVKANKPIIIVINNKLGIDMNSIEAREVLFKIGENLRKIGDRKGISNIETKVEVCMVNAKTALKAKIENKQLMLKKSNIMQLEEMIDRLLRESGAQEVHNALNDFIQNYIDRAITIIDGKIDNVELQKTEAMITYLEKFKQSSAVKLKNIVDKTMFGFIDKLTSTILKEDVTKEEIGAYISETISHINEQAEGVYKNIQSELIANVDNFMQEFKQLDAEIVSVEIPNKGEELEDESMVPDEIKENLKKAVTDKEVLEEGVKQLLFKAKQLLPKEVMHGKGPVWIEKAAGKAAVAITVALEAYNVYSVYSAHQHKIEEKRNRVIEAKESAQKIADQIKVSLNGSINEMIDEIFNDLIINFKNAAQKLNYNNNSLINQKTALVSLSYRLQ